MPQPVTITPTTTYAEVQAAIGTTSPAATQAAISSGSTGGITFGTTTGTPSQGVGMTAEQQAAYQQARDISARGYTPTIGSSGQIEISAAEALARANLSPEMRAAIEKGGFVTSGPVPTQQQLIAAGYKPGDVFYATTAAGKPGFQETTYGTQSPMTIQRQNVIAEYEATRRDANLVFKTQPKADKENVYFGQPQPFSQTGRYITKEGDISYRSPFGDYGLKSAFVPITMTPQQASKALMEGVGQYKGLAEAALGITRGGYEKVRLDKAIEKDIARFQEFPASFKGVPGYKEEEKILPSGEKTTQYSLGTEYFKFLKEKELPKIKEEYMLKTTPSKFALSMGLEAGTALIKGGIKTVEGFTSLQKNIFTSGAYGRDVKQFKETGKILGVSGERKVTEEKIIARDIERFAAFKEIPTTMTAIPFAEFKIGEKTLFSYPTKPVAYLGELLTRPGTYYEIAPVAPLLIGGAIYTKGLYSELRGLGQTKLEAVGSVTQESLKGFSLVQPRTTGIVGYEITSGPTRQIEKSTLGIKSRQIGDTTFSTVKGYASYKTPSQITYVSGVPKGFDIQYTTTTIPLANFQKVSLGFGSNIFRTEKLGEQYFTTGQGLRQVRVDKDIIVPIGRYKLGTEFVTTTKTQAFSGYGLGSTVKTAVTLTGTKGALLYAPGPKALTPDIISTRFVTTKDTIDILASTKKDIGLGKGEFRFRNLEGPGRPSIGRGVTSAAQIKTIPLEKGTVTLGEARGALFGGKTKVGVEFKTIELRTGRVGEGAGERIFSTGGGDIKVTKDISSGLGNQLQKASQISIQSSQQALQSRSSELVKTLAPTMVKTAQVPQLMQLQKPVAVGLLSKTQTMQVLQEKAIVSEKSLVSTKSLQSVLTKLSPMVTTKTGSLQTTTTLTTMQPLTSVTPGFSAPQVPTTFNIPIPTPIIPFPMIPQMGGYLQPKRKAIGRRAKPGRLAPSFTAQVTGATISQPLKVSKTFGTSPFAIRGIPKGKAKKQYFKEIDF